MKNNDFRQMPQAIEAEESVLSACLLGFETEPCELLKPHDFYLDAHKTSFSAISDLQHHGHPVGLVSVSGHLRENGMLENVGGASYLSKLTDTIPISTHEDCMRVKRASIRRQAIIKAQKIMTMAYDEPDFETVIDTAQRAFTDLESASGGDCFTNYRTLAEIMPEKWEKLGQETGVTGIHSGFMAIDKITGGFQPSDLIVIAARPGMGKTALGLNIAEGAAAAGWPVAFYSLEMSGEQLYSRQTSKAARIDGQKLRLGGIQQHEWHSIIDAQSRLYKLPIHIDDTPRQHYMEIARRSRAAVRDHGVKLIIIDYLQLIRGDGNHRKDLEIGDITGTLKGLAKELQLPVILLSQLNRGVEGRDDKRPRLSDLRESGAIEQDADIVLFLYRDEYYRPQTDQPGIAEINFAKHRNGPTGFVKLRWIGWRSSFEDI